MNPRYARVALRAGHRCEYCHAPEVIFNLPFEVDHIIPISDGGADHEENWALSCRSCNLWKASHRFGTDPLSGTAVPLFNPRLDSWPLHFRVEVEDGEIIGLSALGRATAARLRMNSDIQRAARLQWTRLKLFP